MFKRLSITKIFYQHYFEDLIHIDPFEGYLEVEGY